MVFLREKLFTIENRVRIAKRYTRTDGRVKTTSKQLRVIPKLVQLKCCFRLGVLKLDCLSRSFLKPVLTTATSMESRWWTSFATLLVEMAVDRMEGRDTSRSMGQRGAMRTKGRHMNERSIDIQLPACSTGICLRLFVNRCFFDEPLLFYNQYY